MKKGVIDLMIDDLSSNDPSLRSTALSCLMSSGPTALRAVPALKILMEDVFEPFILRLGSAGAITHISPEDPAPLPVLTEGLTNPIGLHRAMACQFIGERRDKNAVLRAAALLCDSEFSVRFAAAEAIGKTFDYWFHAVDVCVDAMRSTDLIHRFAAQECLYSIGPNAMNDLNVLMEAMQTVNWQLRLDMEETLHELRGH